MKAVLIEAHGIDEDLLHSHSFSLVRGINCAIECGKGRATGCVAYW